jgi:carboxylesterase
MDADGIVRGAHTIRLMQQHARAALLLHGFNDTPQSMAYLAAALHAAGWNVVVPRLPGHGTSLPVMARESRAPLWYAAVAREYDALRSTHAHVVICGQSMGGALAVLHAVEHTELPALALLAPYIGMPLGIQVRIALSRLGDFFTPYRVGTGGERSLHDPVAKAQALGPGVITSRTMRELRTVALAAERALSRVTVPTLYLQSREDNRIASHDAERHFAALGSRDKVQRWLTGCGHIISADYCRDSVAEQVIAWFAKHTGSATD